jgi:hypothetical protein
MAEAQMVELLNGLNCSDNDKRSQATKMYKDAKTSNPDELVVTLMKVVGCAEVKQADKKSALVYLRQLVNPNRPDDFSFSKLRDQNKVEVAAGLLMFFEKEADEKVQTSIGNAITALAEYVCNEEDPRGWLVQGQSTGWPQLIPAMLQLSNAQANSNAKSCAVALKILKDLIPAMRGEIVRQQTAIGSVLQIGLGCADISVKTATTLLVIDMVEYLEKKEWAPLANTVPVLVQVCMELARSNNSSDLDDILQAFVSVAGTEPDFFKASMANSFEPAKFMSGCVKSADADPGIRGLALEWLTTYSEKKPKWLTKSVPNFAQVALESCMAMMLEIEDGEAELKAWAERMDDEEGEEDVDELYSNGEECLDRVAEALSMEAISAPLSTLIATFQQQPSWKAQHAALAAVKQTVEYVEEKEHMISMAGLLISNVNHPHPRVRYTALHAIGQLANDQAPQFQEHFHAQVMPLLMTCMDDKVDRVAAMAMSAFVSFAEELKDMMHQYAHTFMAKFLERLTSSGHRGIQEESITAIAVIAAVIGEDFKQYYDTTMPRLKQLILACTGEKQQRLRGKAFECLSLLGVAVGKEKFLPDADQAVRAMLTPIAGQDVDDIQRDYIKEAIERICHCLKKDFAVFLPLVLPGIFSSLNIEQDAGVIPGNRGGGGGDDDDEPIEMNINGKLVSVKSSKFEEMHQSVSMLNTFISTMEEAYFDYIQPTAQALLPVIRFSDEAAMLCEDARSEAFTTWSYLVKAAKEGGQARGVAAPIPMVKELLSTILQECMQLLVKEQQDSEPDMEQLANYSSGISESLKAAGAGYLAPGEAQTLVQQLFGMVDASFKRSSELKAKLKKSTEGAPVELQGDEDDEDRDPLGDETRVRQCFEEALGAVMKASPDDFAKDLPACGEKMKQWLSMKENVVLALHFACDLLEHLKERSCPIWPVFMPKLFDGLGDKDVDVRIAAAYAVNLAATIPAFAEAAPEAFRRCAAVIGGKPPKKRDEKANMAMDNAVAALFSLGRNMSAQCPPDINPFALFVSKLPLKTDLEEAKKVHLLVCQCLQQQHAGLLGANQEHVGKILSCLAEIHKAEDMSNEEIDALILQIFKALPREMIGKFSSSFTEKQQKRIEKMLA